MEGRLIVAMLGVMLAQPGDAAERTIYKCRTVQGTVYADRPCGAGSESYQPDLSSVSVVETAPAAPTPRAVIPDRPQQRKSTATPSNSQICERLEQSLRRIASTFRAGYTARQGERLKERKRELEAQQRAQRCR